MSPDNTRTLTPYQVCYKITISVPFTKANNYRGCLGIAPNSLAAPALKGPSNATEKKLSEQLADERMAFNAWI